MAAAIFILLALILTSVTSNPLKSDALVLPNIEEASLLYNSVVAGNYEDAVTITFNALKSNSSDVIVSAVNRLLTDNINNTVEFAYKLWNTFGQDLVEYYFPVEFSLILSNKSVRIINGAMSKTWYLSVGVDEIGSYGACDNSTETIEWKFEPIWDDNKVYFRILNTDCNLYFNDTNMTDSKITSAQWKLNPKMNNTALKFYFIRRTEHGSVELITYCTLNQDLYDNYTISEEEFMGWYIRPS